jgi:hypothetical protein
MLTHDDQLSVMKDVKEIFLFFLRRCTTKSNICMHLVDMIIKKHEKITRVKTTRKRTTSTSTSTKLIFSSKSKLDPLDDQIKIPFSIINININ